MRLLLNVLWMFLGGGIVLFLEYIIGGLVLMVTIVGIPFGIQCFKLAGLGLFPFGKDIEEDPESAGSGCIGTVCNVIWFLCAGLWICLTHLVLGVAAGGTIIGLPFAFQHLKLARLAVTPFGKKVVED